MCQEHAKLAKDNERLTAALQDLDRLSQERTRELERIRGELRSLHEQSKASQNFVECFVALVGVPKTVEYATHAAADVDAIVGKVLARIPSTGGAVLQVTPPEKLRHDFQQAEVARLLEAVQALTPLARTQFRLLEAVPGALVGQQAMAERLGRSWGGNARVTFVTALKELEGLGVVEIQERVGVRSKLRAKIEADLGFYSAAAGDVDATYQHVLARLVDA